MAAASHHDAVETDRRVVANAVLAGVFAKLAHQELHTFTRFSSESSGESQQEIVVGELCGHCGEMVWGEHCLQDGKTLHHSCVDQSRPFWKQPLGCSSEEWETVPASPRQNLLSPIRDFVADIVDGAASLPRQVEQGIDAMAKKLPGTGGCVEGYVDRVERFVQGGVSSVADTSRAWTRAATEKSERSFKAFDSVAKQCTEQLEGKATSSKAMVSSCTDTMSGQISAGRDKLCSSVSTGKEKVCQTVHVGKEKVSHTVTAGKMKVSQAVCTGQAALASCSGRVCQGKAVVSEAAGRMRSKATGLASFEGVKGSLDSVKGKMQATVHGLKRRSASTSGGA